MSKAAEIRRLEIEIRIVNDKKKETWKELKKLVESTDRCLESNWHLPLYWDTFEGLVANMGRLDFAENTLRQMLNEIKRD